MRRSTYDLSAAVNYAKLAFKAASRDQDAAEATVATILSTYDNDRERLFALAHATKAMIAADGIVRTFST
jgi:membrane glycosyltransferase